MGRIETKLSESSTTYYWYPGEKQEWIRAVLAVAAGGLVGTLLMVVTRDCVTAVVLGASVTLAISGFRMGRRDALTLAGFPGFTDKSARRKSISSTGKAAWRGLVTGVGSALAAVLVLKLSPGGWLHDWVLPVVPAVVFAVARQIGLVWEKLGGSVATTGPAAAPQRVD